MAPVSTDGTFKLTIMVLVVGLVVSFGVGYIAGETSARDTHVIDTSPYPKNYDVAKAHDELLQSCYRYMNQQIVTMLERATAGEKALADLREQSAATQLASLATAKTCETRKITH